MLRLVNQNLPTSTYNKVAAPIAKSVNGSRGAAIARIGFYAQYKNPQSGGLDFDLETEETPPPFWEGDIYRISLPDTEVSAISGFIGSVDRPFLLLPGYWYQRDGVLTIYTSQAYPLPDPLIIESREALEVPVPRIEQLYRFAMVTTLQNVSRIDTEGLRFYPAFDASDPHPQEFVQTDSLLELYASANCYPRIEAEAIVTGERSLTGLARLCKAATFVFPPTFRIFPDVLDYQGKSFRRSYRGWDVRIGEFLWDSRNKRLTAFGA